MEDIEAVVDTGVCASIARKHLPCKLGMWKRTRNVQFWQLDASSWKKGFAVHTSCKVIDAHLILSKCAIDAEVLNIGNREIIVE